MYVHIHILTLPSFILIRKFPKMSQFSSAPISQVPLQGYPIPPCAQLTRLVLILKCYYDQILDIHFFTFSHTIGVSKIFCQISIYYEQQNSWFLDLYFREFTAAINFPCSKSGLRIGENDVIFSKIPHGLKL